MMTTAPLLLLLAAAGLGGSDPGTSPQGVEPTGGGSDPGTSPQGGDLTGGGSDLGTSPQGGDLTSGFDMREVRRQVVCTNPCRVRKNNRLHRQICGNAIMPRMTQKGCKQFSDTFREFKGYGVRKHNFKIFFKLTFAQCKMECLKAEVFCKSFEFHPFSKLSANCHVSPYGFMEVPAVFRKTNLKFWTLLSRNCKTY